MKERSIPMKAHEVSAILEGRKTQTRRILKPKPQKNTMLWHHGSSRGADPFIFAGVRINAVEHRCPYGVPGDRLWVRETWAASMHSDGYNPDGSENVNDCPAYRADLMYACGKNAREDMIWRPSIHMPRWASRITLEITEVRVQRLQDISEEDAISEGCRAEEVTEEDINNVLISDASPAIKEMARILGRGQFTAKSKFLELWDSIYGSDAVKKNPWVWAISFRRIV